LTAALEAWCSGLTCSPVKAETAGSNPVASAQYEVSALGGEQNDTAVESIPRPFCLLARIDVATTNVR
jgi:hypothetical protein